MTQSYTNPAPRCGFLTPGSHQDQGEGVRALEAGEGEETQHTQDGRKRLAENSRRSSEDVQTFQTEVGENLSYMNITCIIIII